MPSYTRDTRNEYENGTVRRSDAMPDPDTTPEPDMTARDGGASGHADIRPPYDRRANKRTVSAIGFSVCAFFAVKILVTYLLAFLFRTFYPETLDAWWMDYVLADIPLYCFALPVLILGLSRVPYAPHNRFYAIRLGTQTVEKPRFTFGCWLLAVGIAWGLLYIGASTGETLMEHWSVIMEYDFSSGLNDMVNHSPTWATVLFVVILGPMGEELIFRKLLISRLRVFGDRTAVYVSALIFALAHGNFYQFFYAFLVGVVLGYVFTRTGRWYVSAALHMFINLVGSILPMLIMQNVDLQLLNTDLAAAFAAQPVAVMLALYYTGLTYLLQAGAAICLIVLRIRRKYVWGDGAVSIKPEDRGDTLFANAGMICAMILLVGWTALSMIPVR